MIDMLLILIFISAALSAASYLYCWQDIKTGRPHIISLRQITGIMDRAELTRLLGAPQPGYYYELHPETLRLLLNKKRAYAYGEIAADIVCMIGAYYYMTSETPQEMAGWFILLASLCQGITIGWSIWLVRKWRHQILEEIENSLE